MSKNQITQDQRYIIKMGFSAILAGIHLSVGIVGLMNPETMRFSPALILTAGIGLFLYSVSMWYQMIRKKPNA